MNLLTYRISSSLRGDFVRIATQERCINLYNKLKGIRRIDFNNRTEYRRISDNKLHHEVLPAVRYITGRCEWRVEGRLDRDNYPAVIDTHKGVREYRKNGKLHNSNGPAYISRSGVRRYYLNGVEYSKDEFERHRHRW